VCAGAGLLIDCFDNAQGRAVLSAHARAVGLPLLHAAVAGDGTFGLVRWDERFIPDAEGHAGEATCEGGAQLPLIGLLSATLARAVQDFVQAGTRRDAQVGLAAVTPT
jgi:molybdopterin-synthase adenylyltransferase